ANDAILSIFAEFPELDLIVEDYLKADRKIKWNDILTGTGLEVGQTPGTGKLAIKTDLNRREKALLTKLGYNRWRKLQKSSN
ncbi:MAG: hypothetical protein KDB79_03970, partial [Acidobacteria bacterium]|nr:hypothetical protein [Acidobacteriota bacterium]